MNTTIPKPNFFLLGAPKCGTTALAAYLGDHPEIFFAVPKEADYFTEYSRSKTNYHSLADYLARLFTGAEEHQAIGVGPTRLLRTPEAIPNILELNPEAQFIVMLRHPAELFESLYWQRVYEGKETARTPEEAWAKHRSIDTGRPRPEDDPEPGELRYGEICRLGEQLERVYKQASPDRVLVIFYEDLKNDPRSVYTRVLSFLEVADDGRQNFPVIHRRKSTRSPLARKLIKLAGRIKKAVGIRRSLRDLPLVQRAVGHTPPLSIQLKRELTAYFKKDIEKLEHLTGRDLSSWKNI